MGQAMAVPRALTQLGPSPSPRLGPARGTCAERVIPPGRQRGRRRTRDPRGTVPRWSQRPLVEAGQGSVWRRVQPATRSARPRQHRMDCMPRALTPAAQSWCCQTATTSNAVRPQYSCTTCTASAVYGSTNSTTQLLVLTVNDSRVTNSNLRKIKSLHL